MNQMRKEELLSRGLDGELAAEERAELDRLLAEDLELHKLEQEWTQYARVLRETSAPPVYTPEAAWADVQRALRVELEERSGPAVGVFKWRLGWVGAMLALVLIGFGAVGVRQALNPESRVAADAGRKPVEVEFVESDLPGASTMVFEDAGTGWTVVWVTDLNEPGSPRDT